MAETRDEALGRPRRTALGFVDGHGVAPGRESKKIVLITGGSGRIGSALIRRLAPHYEIISFSTMPGRPVRPGPHTAYRSVETALKQVRNNYGSRIAAVVHLAGYHSFTGGPDPRFYTLNALGTRRLLRALQDFEVGQFVFSSSMLVHATQEPGRPINEDSPLEPKSESTNTGHLRTQTGQPCVPRR
jgi:nucleoside-diphosphate-sugar epimerase